MIEWDAVFYSLPPEAAGQLVEGRQAVASPLLELRLGGRLVGEHRLAPPGSEAQWLPAHRAAAEAIALARHGACLRPVTDHPALPAELAGLNLGEGDYDVEDPDLDVFETDRPAPVSTPLWTWPQRVAQERLPRAVGASGASREQRRADRTDQRRSRLPEAAPQHRGVRLPGRTSQARGPVPPRVPVRRAG